ncbi:2-amino-4-hydroxy-6-hydroxymethyldihydropteridine diphosphokinase [Pedobacter sp. HMF7647]|uniref:2-amino-4-hydroxy-6-hydroxymethyldihydropteridine pyrophosphokinase n=1 Tax=Hufsiella arboris TaxID=2695275 RepID=A0A7K1YD83_9SPHI|nr:2-amino-4-hydroxy-6-hydroxymethyldihydropteridine diphosphokinase [Hufsiella arboris]MXV52535.1 2-amino-4-hydroxy-6-hydroxymethyldihydropteridine diphosphokinase [Hufsiella arboris]
MNQVYLLTGSNLGDRKLQLETAGNLIGERIGAVKRQSSVYETASWGKTDQPDFYNQVLLVGTNLSAHEVLMEILAIERELGRERHEKWGSRLIDIDILFFNDEIIKEDQLIVPHPFLHQRRFTLVPLNEIAPTLKHPELHLTIQELLINLDDKLVVNRI